MLEKSDAGKGSSDIKDNRSRRGRRGNISLEGIIINLEKGYSGGEGKNAKATAS